MNESKKNDFNQNGENSQTNDTENSTQEKNEINISKPEENKDSQEKIEIINEKEKKEPELSILKEVDFIQALKINNYEDLIKKNNFVDFRLKDEKSWKVGLIHDISDDSYIIADLKEDQKHQIKKNDANKISYFRKYSKPDNEENFFLKRDNKEALKKRLDTLEYLTKNENDNIFNKNAWETYYILHSKFFLGLDAAMKINRSVKYSYFHYGSESDQNEGFEESFKIILCILLFLSKYYKYIGENIDEFIYYKKEIIGSKLEDIKVLNQKCAFFSFFEESCDLLNKIFANEQHCLFWYTTFEKQLQKIVTSPSDEDNENEEIEEENNSEYPQYELSDKDKDKENKINGKNEIRLKKICLINAYNPVTTFTSCDVKIKAKFVAYFIDYFNAINGFSYLAQIMYLSKNIYLELLDDLISKFQFAKILTDSYSKTLFEEKIKLCECIDNIIESLDEKTISEKRNDDIKIIIEHVSKKLFVRDVKLSEKLNFHYVAKNLICSKKLEQKINSLTSLNTFYLCNV